MSHNSFPQLLSETERRCLRSCCCHKVLISHDISVVWELFAQLANFGYFPTTAFRSGFVLCALGLRILSLNVEYQVSHWIDRCLLLNNLALKVNIGKKRLCFISSKGKQCWWCKLTELLHLCQLSFHSSRTIFQAPPPTYRHYLFTCTTHTHSHALSIYSQLVKYARCPRHR